MQSLVEGIGTACIDHDGGLGVLALKHHSIGNHAYVAYQTHQLDFIGFFRQHGSGGRIGYIHAEYQLVNGLGFHFREGFGSLAVDLPAEGSLDAMDNRKFFSLSGFQIVFKVGIPGKKNLSLAIFAHLCGDFAVQLFRTGEAKGAVYEVILVINYK